MSLHRALLVIVLLAVGAPACGSDEATDPRRSVADPLETPAFVVEPTPASPSATPELVYKDVAWGLSEDDWNRLRTPLPADAAYGLSPAYGPVLMSGRGEIEGVVFAKETSAAIGFTVNFDAGTSLMEARAAVQGIMPRDAKPGRLLTSRECARQVFDSPTAVEVSGEAVDGSAIGPFAAFFTGPLTAEPRPLDDQQVDFANVTLSTLDEATFPPCG